MHKYAQAVAIVRAQITDGTLKPGQPAPSGDALARLTGFSTLTCRKALRILVAEGTLSALTGYSVTTIGHAETGRLWQSREFWEKADLALAADGELTRLHDACRAETPSPADTRQSGTPAPDGPAGPPALTYLTLHWSDGTATTAYPSDFPTMTGNGGRRDSRAAYLRSPPRG